MLGFYDYTVVLTYLSLLSAGSGIVVSLSDGGHPYWGIFFLLLCGLFDAFDGKVARTKKNRTQMEMSYGIQIDSLADVIAFGVLPAVIGIALLRTSPALHGAGLFGSHWTVVAIKIFLYAILMKTGGKGNMMLVEFKLALALITIVILLVVIVLLLVAILALNKQIASFINEKFSENGEKDVGSKN